MTIPVISRQVIVKVGRVALQDPLILAVDIMILVIQMRAKTTTMTMMTMTCITPTVLKPVLMALSQSARANLAIGKSLTEMVTA
jgi:hypothetical protein